MPIAAWQRYLCQWANVPASTEGRTTGAGRVIGEKAATGEVCPEIAAKKRFRVAVCRDRPIPGDRGIFVKTVGFEIFARGQNSTKEVIHCLV